MLPRTVQKLDYEPDNNHVRLVSGYFTQDKVGMEMISQMLLFGVGVTEEFKKDFFTKLADPLQVDCFCSSDLGDTCVVSLESEATHRDFMLDIRFTVENENRLCKQTRKEGGGRLRRRLVACASDEFEGTGGACIPCSSIFLNCN